MVKTKTVHLTTDLLYWISHYYTTTTHTVSQTVQQSGEESIVFEKELLKTSLFLAY